MPALTCSFLESCKRKFSVSACSVEISCQNEKHLEEKLNKHFTDLHSLSRNVQYDGRMYALSLSCVFTFGVGSTVLITRGGHTGKLSCPCGNPKHARRSYQKVYSLCRKKPHPVDDDAFPDSPLHTEQPESSTSNNIGFSGIDVSMADDDAVSDLFIQDRQEAQLTAFQPSLVSAPPRPQDWSPIKPPQNVSDPPKPQAPMHHLTPSSQPQPSSDPTTQPPVPPTSPSPHETSLSSEALASLASLGLQVDPTYRLIICVECKVPIKYEHTYGHLHTNHRQQPRSSFPSKLELENMLVSLNAHDPLSVFPGPISPIPGILVVDAVKCTVVGCSHPSVFSDSRRFREHCQNHHPNAARSYTTVKAHPLGHNIHRQLIEVTHVIVPPSGSLLSDMEAHVDSIQLYKTSDVFQPLFNARMKGSLFAQVGWDGLLVNVKSYSSFPSTRLPGARSIS
ncbi:hypothetical protein J3R83DRAFT_10133 [Lanmaoa asiatica]|nr:hypothetical protein J3R83DRAFT_10133 [Lanmaoa asiatica]